MMAEVASLLFTLVLSSQSSSLWSSLIIIPLGFSFISLSVSLSTFSGFMIVVYSMVFIGGLLVLLVSVASISYQEQGFSVKKTVVMGGIIMSFPLMLSYQTPESNPSTLMLVMWFNYQSEILFFLLLVLMVALLLISNNVSLFKGMIRMV